MKAKKPFYVTILCVLATFFMQGCTIPSICHLYNGTGNQISIIITFNDIDPLKIQLKPDAMATIKWPSILAITIDMHNNNQGIIDTWKYDDLPYIKAEHWIWKGIIFKRHYFNAQLVSDGTIAILKKDQKYPVSQDQAVVIIQPKDIKDVPNKSL